MGISFTLRRKKKGKGGTESEGEGERKEEGGGRGGEEKYLYSAIDTNGILTALYIVIVYKKA